MLARAGRAHSRRTANRQPGPINGVNQRKQTQALATSGEQRVLPGRSPTAKPSSFSRRIPAGVRRRQRGLATARGTARIEASVSSANNGFGLRRTTSLFVCWPDCNEKRDLHIKYAPTKVSAPKQRDQARIPWPCGANLLKRLCFIRDI